MPGIDSPYGNHSPEFESRPLDHPTGNYLERPLSDPINDPSARVSNDPGLVEWGLAPWEIKGHDARPPVTARGKEDIDAWEKATGYPEIARPATVEMDLGHTATDQVVDYDAKENLFRQPEAQELQNAAELAVRFETFEAAEHAANPLPDSFIDDALSDALFVGGEQKMSIKNYLDQVEMTDSDRELMASPERLADLYEQTSEVIARNLKLKFVRRGTQQEAEHRKSELKAAKDAFIDGLRESMPDTKSQIVSWSSGDQSFPVGEMEYREKPLVIDGSDILNAETNKPDDVRPNIKVQRQVGGTFIMGYSDTRVESKMAGQADELQKRIYLNPDAEAVPVLFEQILQTANDHGIELQLKMLQRAPELATAQMYKQKGMEADALRGDGMVVYVGSEHANDVLDLVLALAKDKPEAFKGRQTSRVPLEIADGIAVGDEPLAAKGKSLTSHRAEMIEDIVSKVKASGKTGDEARQAFRRGIRALSERAGINPDNLAFNATMGQ